MDAERTFESSDKPNGFFSRFVVVCAVALVLYVLSFGPIMRLTATVIDGRTGRVTRVAPFRSWCRWTNVVYSPLFAVMGGWAGQTPRAILTWYVNLWGG